MHPENDRRDSKVRVSKVERMDILMGRESLPSWQVGTINLIQDIDNRLDQYTATEGRAKKTAIIQNIYDTANRQGRFLCRDDDAGGYMELSEEAAKEKISHMIRYRRKRKQKYGVDSNGIVPGVGNQNVATTPFSNLVAANSLNGGTTSNESSMVVPAASSSASVQNSSALLLLVNNVQQNLSSQRRIQQSVDAGLSLHNSTTSLNPICTQTKTEPSFKLKNSKKASRSGTISLSESDQEQLLEILGANDVVGQDEVELFTDEDLYSILGDVTDWGSSVDYSFDWTL